MLAALDPVTRHSPACDVQNIIPEGLKREGRDREEKEKRKKRSKEARLIRIDGAIVGGTYCRPVGCR